MKLAMNSVNASFGRDAEKIVPHPCQFDFSKEIEGIQVTASSKRTPNRALNRIDETGGNITDEVGDLSVNDRKSDRQPQNHHSCIACRVRLSLKQMVFKNLHMQCPSPPNNRLEVLHQ